MYVVLKTSLLFWWCEIYFLDRRQRAQTRCDAVAVRRGAVAVWRDALRCGVVRVGLGAGWGLGKEEGTEGKVHFFLGRSVVRKINER